MRATTTNGRSIVIGTLLAALSAGCLIAFTLVAGSADYPTRGPVVAAQPRADAPPVNLVARTDDGTNGDRSPRVRPDPGSDPTAPIVLGTRISSPEADGNDGDGRRDRTRRDGRKGGSRSTDDDDKKSDKNSYRDGDGGTGGPHLAKPIAHPEGSKTFEYSNGKGNGNAYGHYKNHNKNHKPSGPKSSGPSASSKGSHGNGPPAHAQAHGHDKSSGPPPHAASNDNGSSGENESPPSSSSSSENESPPSSEDGSGPPPHASSNGHDEAPGPPDHAQANGHDKDKG
jgi:hypothetical protein